ncbi:MAG: hypothetical protein AAB433_07535, partial [Nitrospirota bacterium]
VSLDPIRIVDPLFLHHSTGTLVLTNQQGHRIPPLNRMLKKVASIRRSLFGLFGLSRLFG